MNSSHKKRIVTAAVLLPVLICSIAFRGWLEIALLAAISVIGLWEFYSMFWKDGRHSWLKIAGAGLGLLILWGGKTDMHGLILAALIAGFWVSSLWFLLRFSKAPEAQTEENSFGMASVLVTGLLYVPVMLQFLFNFERVEIVVVLAAVMAADTGAFYSGAAFGGPKIWPVISPKKTWAGSIGGMCASILVCLLAGCIDEYMLAGAGAGRPWWMWACLGFGLNISSQFGDFIESAVKRRLRVKDSGTLLPGHGGVLDRIDSLLLAIATYAGLDAIFHFFK